MIIHLKRAEKRGAHVRELMQRLPIEARILDAVDAQKLAESEIAAVYSRRSRHFPPYPFELRVTEIACFLSHRKAWQAIVDDNLDAGLVIEDDVDIDPGFADQLKLAGDTIKPADYIRFPRWARGEEGGEISRQGEISIMQPKLPGLGMQMQLIGRDAAIALLEATKRFDRPVDTTLQMRWLHPVRMLSARPITIREIDFNLGGTVVQGKKSLSDKLKREVLRPYYRVLLFFYSKIRG
nr:glycosyltransferase family 25 protein [Phyllobacterium myrsinacearum]